MASEFPAEALVAALWPSIWTDSGLVRVFAGSPVNCLIADGPAGGIAEAAQKAGMTVYGQPPPGVVAIKGIWPRIRPFVHSGT